MRITHISPTFYSNDSVIGGGEKYILYMIKAIQAAAAKNSRPVYNSKLAFGGNPGAFKTDGDIDLFIIKGRGWEPSSIDTAALCGHINSYDVVVVHQCLSGFGLFVAAHARLLGKTVFGLDHGGGEHELSRHTREIGLIFDAFFAQSTFAANAFQDLDADAHVLFGPIDTPTFKPDYSAKRTHLLSVGRLLPHKGFERIIRALTADGPPLIIAGNRSDQHYFDFLRTVIDESKCKVEILLGLSDGDVLSLMQSSIAYIHASTHHSFDGTFYPKPELLGLAPLEALSCGTPIIVSSAGALPELGQFPGVSVFTSEEELREQLVELIRAPFDPRLAARQAEAVNTVAGPISYGESFLMIADRYFPNTPQLRKHGTT